MLMPSIIFHGRNDTGHSGYGNTLVALCSHNPAAGLNHLIESTRFDDARLHAGGLRLSRRQYDFVAMAGGSFRSMLVFVAGSFVLMVMVFALMVMTFVIMSRMGVFFRFVVVSFTGLTIAGAQQEQSYDPHEYKFLHDSCFYSYLLLEYKIRECGVQPSCIYSPAGKGVPFGNVG